MKKKIGIFGGTFSPPHLGHVQAAEFFLEEMKLDELWIMPDYIPPHKQTMAVDGAESRMKLVRAAFENRSEKMIVSDYEIAKAGVSYTAETLAHFASSRVHLYFLCGTDMFLSLDTWYHPEEIFRLCTPVCSLRNDAPEDEKAVRAKAAEYRKKYHRVTHILKGRPLEISSTEIRERVRAGLSIRHLVPETVETLIREQHYYV